MNKGKELKTIFREALEEQLNWKYQYPKDYKKWKENLFLDGDVEDVIEDG